MALAETGRMGGMGWRVAPTQMALMAAVLALAASPVLAGMLPAALVDYPKQAVIGLAAFTGSWLTWLAREAAIGPLRIAEITRGLANVVEAPIALLNTLFAEGIQAGRGDQVRTVVPPLSWLAGIGLAALLAHMVGGRQAGPKLVALIVVGLLYIVLFGFWTDAMFTLTNVIISAVAAIALGIWIGTKAVTHPRIAAPVEGLMNVMQTVPVFSYLVPTLLFLGYGPSAALVATVIYALPPMVHATMLGLRGVPPEVVEFGRMAGASPRALFWKIRLPVALPQLAIGINQTIMACLNMVVIASMIGAGGLGFLVLTALRKLDIGGALQAGIAIVVLAVILDRLSLAAARLAASGTRIRSTGIPHGRLALGWFALASIAALLLPAFQSWPKELTLTTAPFWNGLVSWINIHWFEPLDAFRSFTLIHIMNPVKAYLLDLPWTLVIALVMLGGWMAGGARLGLTVGAMALFIAATGFWDPAVTSVYLVGLGTLLSLIIGLPFGYVVSRRQSWRDAASLVLDTLQTLPTLVYLLPAVMVFRNGDFSALVAIVSYAIAPAVRYSMHAFAGVPAERLELAAMVGASRWQTFKWVRLPAAFPTLLLGLNQTIMLAIAMLVITALVGTRDLGQQVFIALSRAKPGDGIIAGLCVAAIALIADMCLKAWARRAAARNGVEA
ncbi:MAG: ABC transporter permease subunit [Rhizobiaceae bacterium]|nr:ABC transporter permease subunit [Rhizobiaceae bacterium]